MALTLLATGTGDFIFWRTMQDAREATTRAHADAIAAIKKAHDDSAAALLSSNQSSTIQHSDTLAALERATEANDISKQNGDKQLSAFKASAEAAAKSADAAAVQSRAFISITNIEARVIESGNEKLLQLRWQATNSGNTPGVIEHVPLLVTTYYTPDRFPAIKELPDRYGNPKRPIFHRIILAAKESKYDEVFPQSMDAETAGIVGIGGSFQVFGQVIYKDMLGKEHVSGFSFQVRITDKGSEAREVPDANFVTYN